MNNDIFNAYQIRFLSLLFKQSWLNTYFLLQPKKMGYESLIEEQQRVMYFVKQQRHFNTVKIFLSTI